MSMLARRLQTAAVKTTAAGNGEHADETNTGVERFGLTLTNFTGYGSFSSTQSFEGVAFISENMGNGYIRVDSGGNLTFNKCYVKCKIDCDGTNRSITFIDCTLDGNRDVLCVGYSNMTLIRCNIFNGIECINIDSRAAGNNMSNVLIENCYVHHPYLVPNSDGHVNPLYCSGGDGITIRGTTFWSPVEDNAYGGGTSTNLSFYGDFTPFRNILVENCFFKATPAAWGVSLGHNPGKPFGNDPTNIIFRNNVFERGPTGHNATYGPITSFLSANGNQFYGNKYEDGVEIPPNDD